MAEQDQGTGNEGAAQGGQRPAGEPQGGTRGNGTGEGGDGAGDGAAGAGAGTQGAEGGTVNRYKHEREVGRLNDEIADLKARLADAEGRAGDASKVAEEVAKLKAELADEKLCSKLASAGCVDAKAAKARLGDFGGDVGKLKAACPYLFDDGGAQKVGSTGGQPATGGARTTESRIEAAFAKR